MEKTWNSGELSQEGLANLNDSESRSAIQEVTEESKSTSRAAGFTRHPDEPQDFGENMLWTENAKV